MTMHRRAVVVLAGLALGGVGLGAGASGAGSEPAQVIREGAGARRAQLDALELKPLNPAFWSAVGETLSGKPVTAADGDGRVVVIYTWSSFLAGSDRPMAALNRLAAAHPDDVLVVGLHHPEGWDGAKAAAERRKAAFPIARDVDGKARALLMVDQDPDLYIVDRAGQLRFADVDIASLDAAVQLLVAESRDAASGTLSRLAGDAATKAELERRTRLLRQQVELGNLPEVSFEAPGAVEYESAKWPRMWKYRGRDASGERKKDTPRPLDLGVATWDPAPPDRLDGRVRLVYLSTVDSIGASGDFSAFYDDMQRYQRAHLRDLVVAGGFMPIRNDQNASEDADAAAARLKRLKDRYAAFVARRPMNHPTSDMLENGSLHQVIVGEEGQSTQEIILPYIALVSSDGQLRWHGHYGRDQEDFRAALATMLEVDPGVKSRRAAEEDHIRRAVEAEINGTPVTPGPAAEAEAAAPRAKPDAKAYASAAWPKANTGDLGATSNLHGSGLPMPLGSEEWLTRKVSTEGKVLVIDFWATWCPPCRRSSPIFDRLQKENPESLVVLAVSGSGEDRGTVASFIAEHPTSYHHVFDGQQRLSTAVGVQGIPHTLVLSTDGVVRWQGNPLEDGFADAVRQVIKADPMFKSN